MLTQPPLSVQRRHRPRSGAGDSLPVDAIGHVPRREHTRHGCAGTIGLRNNVTTLVHVDGATVQNLGVRIVPNGDKGAVCLELDDRPCAFVSNAHVCKQGLSVLGELSEECLYCGVPLDLNFRVFQHALGENVARAERVPPVDHCDLGRCAGQHHGIFHRSVAAPDDHDGLVAEQKPVARCARRHPTTTKLVLALGAKPATVCSRRHDNRVGFDGGCLGVHCEHTSDGALNRHFDVFHELFVESSAECRGLFAHVVHNDGTGDAGNAWEVFY
mmetsp:Transcript_149926/g.364181  ORF Transcript_149926/g.364181 Transcript_149926/m.364181 type:complete len:272 (-) Transcript_149926:23-838(-)